MRNFESITNIDTINYDGFLLCIDTFKKIDNENLKTLDEKFNKLISYGLIKSFKIDKIQNDQEKSFCEFNFKKTNSRGWTHWSPTFEDFKEDDENLIWKEFKKCLLILI